MPSWPVERAGRGGSMEMRRLLSVMRRDGDGVDLAALSPALTASTR